jgi:protein-tyrosine phosphatase
LGTFADWLADRSAGMTQVVDWKSVAPRQAIRRCVQALLAGQLVAFPTETVYGVAASALHPDAVERLRQGKRRPEDKPLTLALGSARQAFDWVPEMSPLGRRLGRRCWPGPLTLVLKNGLEQSLASRLPENVQQRVCPEGTLGLRVPAHDSILQTLRQLPGPLVLSSANRSGEPAATTGSEVIRALGDEAALVVDDGPTRYGQASTVVRVDGNSWAVLREGVLSSADLERQASRLIVFVCTGNTCRSPMAEVLCKKLLAEHLGCPPDELPQRGFLVLSAGLAAMMGGGPAEEAVVATGELGAELANHASRPLTPQLVAQADHLIAMTRDHLRALTGRHSQLGVRPQLLSLHGEDLSDPIGCEQQVYRDCAQQILRDMKQLLPQLLQ